MLELGLVAIVVWLVGWLSLGHAEVSTTPLATTAMTNEMPPKSVSVAATSPFRPELKSASRDPFVINTAPPPLPPAVVVSPVVAAPVIHREPPPTLSFAGRMQSPDGRVVILARWADGTPVRLEQGKDLGNGFRVERMTEQSVELLNPQTQSMVQLSLPAVPRFETR